MHGLIAQFIDHIAYERGLSANTCSAYEADLLAFAAFLQRTCKVVSVAEVTREHIASFLDSQRQKRMSVRTLARRLVAIKVFFAYLFAEGRVGENIAEVMDAPNKGRQLPRTLSEAEVAQLLESVRGASARDVRDRSMLELFYACGLRVSEVVALRLGDVRLEEGLVRCIGKGDKQRIVPVGGAARQWLERYLAQSRTAFAKGDPDVPEVFLTRLGKPFTRQGIFAMLVKRARAAGIASDFSPHVLRHCFASHLLVHGANIRAIQEMLGHADIATTQIYTHLDRGQTVGTHVRFHPRHTRPR